ncbi:MAG: S9 family peptidase [Gemmatimonadota bacterium]
MRFFRAPLAVLLLTCVAVPLSAQTQDPSLLSLERIFGSPEFSGQRFGPARWLADGSGYTTVERSVEIRGGQDIVRYDPESGDREVLVPASELVPEGGSEPLYVNDYHWSEDGAKLLIFTNTKRVWRDNTRGDYWVLDLETGELQQVGGDADESSLMFAKFSPDGRRVGYVHDNNIYVENLANGRITPITTDGSETIINGTSDWVNEEEFFLRDCFRWSPDGRSIAYWQFDVEGVREFQMINNTDSLYPRIISFQYPKAGETNSAIRVGVVSANGGATTWFKLENDPRNNYIPRMEWAASSEEVVIQYMNRLQNTNQVMLGDARTGEVHVILTEHDDAWVDVVDDLEWLDGGMSFIWISERDGWRHVYVVPRSGRGIRLVTPGDFDVISVQRVDEERGWLYYIASPEDPTQRYLYRTRLSGSGRPERLTPADQGGTNSYQISQDGRWAFSTHSSFGVPSTRELVRLEPEYGFVRTLVDNKRLRESVDAFEKGPAEFFRVDIGDGVLLDGWMMKPPDFDPSMQYPVLFYVYGEPWGQTVRDAWMGPQYLWYLMLTQRGYIVMSVDNRGTPAPRGRDWRKIVYQKIGVLTSADQAAAMRKVEEWPYIDPDRTAIWGWSGGGSSTLNGMFRYPDVYEVGMAVAPVPDVRLYDTIYQERYTGLPQDDPEVYEQSSPVTFADQLQGKLLIVHGTGDDNVHYQGTEKLINALVAAGKQFTMMAYPNRSHGIYEGRGTTLHVYTLLTEFLEQNVPPGPRPQATK